MDFLKFATERYSVRKFQDKKVEKEVIDKIIACSHVAPTGCNYQPQRILVINSAEALEKLKDCTKCHFNAPLSFLVCYNKDESWVRKYDGALSAPVDASIVATHMLLMAHSLGLGACWVMHFNPEKIKQQFNLPQNYVPHALLMLGYPDKDSVPLPLHNEVRPINEVVFYNNFKND
jgi:nitroreductase